MTFPEPIGQKRQHVDFLAVPDHQSSIHDRLVNWALWCAVRPGRYSCPTFRWAKPAQHWDAIEPRPAIDGIDAQAMEKGVCALPNLHRAALQWCYVYRFSPAKACRILAVRMDTLGKVVSDGRQMLINRRV